MAVSPGFANFVKDQMEQSGPVSLRRMFGGVGIFRDGLMFALIAGDVLHFKTDEPGRAAFEAEGLGPFSYPTKRGEQVILGYWRAPARCLDDAGEMAQWAARAFDVASARRRDADRPPTGSALRRLGRPIPCKT